jgi:hypothetical protein
MKSLPLALRFASRHVMTAIAAMSSLAIGAGTLAAFLSLREETAAELGAAVTSGEPALDSLSLAVALVGAAGFVFLASLRMRSRRKSCAVLKAVGATSLSLFSTLVIEAFILAFGGAVLSIVVSTPLMIFARESLASKGFEPGFLATIGLAYSMLVALFAIYPAVETTLHCAREEGSGESGEARSKGQDRIVGRKA